MTRINEAAKIEKIVDYVFERNEKSNVLAIHPSRPLIAYLISIQKTQKISKAWSSGNESLQSPSSSINGQNNNNSNSTSFSNSNNNADKKKTISIRIIDYATRQRCLAKGIYHARPADCAFTINSLLCAQASCIKLAVVDRLANIYLYDVSYFINELVATRIAVIRGPGQDTSPYESINLVWCPFVPCEDFDDGDGGLRLALATESKIEIFAIDKLQGRTGEMLRSDLKGAYKCIQNAHKTNIVSMSISPDCSTISTAASDNRITFFSSDIDDGGQKSLHDWVASVADKSSISKLFFLDDYPKLLEDSTMKFWGAAFIGTKSGQMLLVDLRTWSVYQKMSISTASPETKNFDYRIDMTSRNIIAMNVNECHVIQLVTDGLPKIVKTTRLALHNPIYSFVIKYKSDDELDLFTISAYSLERLTINLNAISNGVLEEDIPLVASLAEEARPTGNTPHELKRFLQQFDGSLRISSSGNAPNNTPNNSDVNILNTSVNLATPIKQQDMDVYNLMNASMNALELGASHGINVAVSTPPMVPAQVRNASANLNTSNTKYIKSNSASLPQPPPPQPPTSQLLPPPQSQGNVVANLDVVQMDRMVEALFTKLNTAFSQGLDEFLNDVKCEVNDLKLKLNGLCRDVRKLQQQLQETRQK